MPKLTPETEEIKSKRLTNLYIKTGSQKRVAELEGVTKQAINQRFHKPAVKKALQEIINQNLERAGITQTKVYRKLDEQLDATRVISAVVSPDGKDMDANGQTCDFVDVPDNTARDKAIDKCLTLMGHIKQVNGNGKGVSIVNIMYGYRVNAPDRTIRSEERAS